MKLSRYRAFEDFNRKKIEILKASGIAVEKELATGFGKLQLYQLSGTDIVTEREEAIYRVLVQFSDGSFKKGTYRRSSGFQRLEVDEDSVTLYYRSPHPTLLSFQFNNSILKFFDSSYSEYTRALYVSGTNGNETMLKVTPTWMRLQQTRDHEIIATVTPSPAEAQAEVSELLSALAQYFNCNIAQLLEYAIAGEFKKLDRTLKELVTELKSDNGI